MARWPLHLAAEKLGAVGLEIPMEVSYWAWKFNSNQTVLRNAYNDTYLDFFALL